MTAHTAVRQLSGITRILLTLALAAALPRLEVRADGRVPQPVTASLGRILATPPATWRDASFEVYRWDRFPQVLVFDTISTEFQDRMFTRLAYLLEKDGYRGRMMTDAELRGLRGWNAHDYGSGGLAEFYSRAAADAVPLDAEELLLRDVAAANGVIVPRGGRFDPGTGGVLSITRDSGPALRSLFLAHESFHGLFFSSAEFRSICYGLWDSMTSDQRSFFRALLEALGYATDDPYLVVNETQAYLLQQPLDLAAGYLERVASLVPRSELPSGGVDVLLPYARKLDRVTRELFGIEAGAASLVTGGGGP